MKRLTMRTPVFVGDLAAAIGTSEFEIHKSLIRLEIFSLPPGLLADEVATKVAEMHDCQLNLEEGEQFELEQAIAEQREADRKFLRRSGRSGKEPD